MQPRGRTFTLEEATALLPTVDRLLAEAQALAERLRAAEEAAQAEQWKLRANGHVRVAQSGAASSAAQRRAMAEQLARLIDFPSPREGRIVYLCWQRGEPLEIRWWHEVEAGFAGRQPL